MSNLTVDALRSREMTDFIGKQEESPELSEEDYQKACDTVENIFHQVDELLDDPAINSRKEIYDMAAEIFSGLSRLDSILRIEHILRGLD